MALLDSNWKNAILGLASYSNPGLLKTVMAQQGQDKDRTRQAAEDKRRRDWEDYQRKIAMDKQASLGKIGGLLSSSSPYVTRESEGPPQLMGMQEQAGPPQMIPGGFPSTQGPPSLEYPQSQPLLGPQPTERYSRTGLLAQEFAKAGMPKEALSLLAPKTKEGFTLGPDQIRFSGEGQEVARGIKKEAANPFKVINKQLFDTRTNTWVDMPAGSTQADLKDVRALAGDAEKKFAPIRIASNAATQLDVLLSREGPYSDVASLVNTVKVLDPESVVKEGEVAVVTSAQGIYDQLQSIVKRAKGEGILSDTLKADMRGALAEIMKVYQSQGGKWKDHFSRYAKDYRIPAWQVLGPDIEFPDLTSGTRLPGKPLRQIK